MEKHEGLTVLSVFSGLGGLDLGLEAAGFTHVGCVESDETAKLSLKVNRGGAWPLLDPGDVTLLARSLKPSTLHLERRELALLAGGPPCQPFSKAAQWSRSARTGLDDVRSHCLRDFLSLVETFLPSVVLIENVSGLVRGPVSALAEIVAAVAAINHRQRTQYFPHYRIVDAADYGVPQHRQRAMVIMTRDGVVPAWPETTHSTEPATAWDAIGALPVPVPPPKAVGKWAELLPSIPEGQNYLWHTNHGGGLPLFGYRTRYWSFLLKLKKTQPSWTVSAQPGPSTGPFHWDNRPLTVSELLALQSFPADWQVEGGHREQVRQVGNATPPHLAEVFGRAIARETFGVDYAGTDYSYLTPRSVTVPRARARTAVPSRYERLVGDHQDHPGAGKGPRPRTVATTAPAAKEATPTPDD